MKSVHTFEVSRRDERSVYSDEFWLSIEYNKYVIKKSLNILKVVIRIRTSKKDRTQCLKEKGQKDKQLKTFIRIAVFDKIRFVPSKNNLYMGWQIFLMR